MKQISLNSYAKINLGLDVLNRREDGYHNVRMIMQTISLHDKIFMKKILSDKIIIDTNIKFLSNEHNLCYKACMMLKEEFNIKSGIYINLKKYIPISAGMAGGSTNCASVLYGMNCLFNLKLTKKELMEYGVKLGADVPYCILRGTALSEGIGEILTPLNPMPFCYILIAKPSISVSTKYIYENLNLNNIKQHPDIDGIINGLNNKNLNIISSKLENVLETVTIKEYPIIEELKNIMIDCGALNSLMSGSGPTVFGIFNNKKATLNAYNKIKYSGIANQVFITKPFNIFSNSTYNERRNKR